VLAFTWREQLTTCKEGGNMTPQLDPIMTVGEMAEYLKISRSKAYAMVARKEIPHIRIGKNVRIRVTDLLKWLETQMEGQMTKLFEIEG
jgi:excisionase family DNA binding protein